LWPAQGEALVRRVASPAVVQVPIGVALGLPVCFLGYTAGQMG